MSRATQRITSMKSQSPSLGFFDGSARVNTPKGMNWNESPVPSSSLSAKCADKNCKDLTCKSPGVLKHSSSTPEKANGLDVTAHDLNQSRELTLISQLYDDTTASKILNDLAENLFLFAVSIPLDKFMRNSQSQSVSRLEMKPDECKKITNFIGSQFGSVIPYAMRVFSN